MGNETHLHPVTLFPPPLAGNFPGRDARDSPDDGMGPPISKQVRTGNESRAAVQEAAETVSDNCPGIVENPRPAVLLRLPGCNSSYDDCAR